jgi:hypothetical protein
LIWYSRQGRVRLSKVASEQFLQQEDLLQLVECPVDRACAREGTEILALLLLRAPVFLDLRKPVRAADQDVGEAFVVAQKHVVLRLELLDEVLLQQQRLGFRPRRQEHHRRGFPDHPGDARAVSGGLGVGRHPLFQRPRLADIEHSALRIEHAIDTRRVVELTEVISGSPHGRFRRDFARCRTCLVVVFDSSGGCNGTGAISRHEKSPNDVDNLAEKSWASRFFLCFRPSSANCIKFRR